MIPWIELARTTVPGEAAALRLIRRGDEFAVMLGPIELMNSRLHALGRGAGDDRPASDRATRAGAAVLIGGLGMGFTLRAALGVLAGRCAASPSPSWCPAIVAWARGPMAELFGDCLDDPRVDASDRGRVGAMISGASRRLRRDPARRRQRPRRADASAQRPALPGAWPRRRARRACARVAMLAVWASARDEAFSTRLRRAGFGVEVVPVRSGGSRNFITVATRA